MKIILNLTIIGIRLPYCRFIRLLKLILSSAQDQDWYAIDAAYDGFIKLWLNSADSSGIRVRFDSGETFIANTTTDGSQPFTVSVTKGRTYVQLQYCGSFPQDGVKLLDANGFCYL